MSGSSEMHTVWPTYILIAAYGEVSDWQEFSILPLQLRLSEIDVKAESESAQLKGPS